MDFLIDIVRSFFFFLDGLIYSFIVIVYNLFVDIAQTSIFTDEIIDLFASRVYVLLGIFMLFKVSFSILTYIINPDSFLDKNKGFPKLISNILITLVLLLLTPWIFSQLMDIQRIILRDNIIGKIFSTTDTNSNVIGDAGNVMAYQTYKAFFHINTDVYTSCVDLEKNYDPSNPSAFDECKTKGFNDSDNFENFAQNLRYAYETNSISIYMNSDLLNQNGSDNDYTMYYLPFISTLAGGAIALLLIVFCFDIAVRSIKLGFLRMLAPVPIVSRIDPQKGKEVFDKWLKLCISVYLDLFIRLIAIYFAIFVITQLMDFKMVDAVTGLEKDINVFVRVFIILGALLFAKQLPQLISDLTGVKMDGKFTLNPLKKVGEVPLVGGTLAAGAVMAGGGALALGRGGANLIGGGLKKGVGAGLDKLSGGRVGKGLMNSGDRTLKNAKFDMQRRWSRTQEEARGRFSSSGLLGGEFKGDTAGAIYRKEREERRKKARQADIDITEQRSLHDLGTSSIEDMPDPKSFEEYQEAGFQSKEFINSLLTIDANKKKLTAARTHLREIQRKFENKEITDANLVAKAEEEYEKAQKILSSAEENHSKFIAPRHEGDAMLEKARKIAKGNRP